jgi:hypothetical protein
MEIKLTDTFFKSFKKFVNSFNPWRFAYWQHKWHDLQNAVWALRKYFKIVTKMVPWDYSSVLKMMKFQINILADNIEKHGMEVDETRLPKVEKMRRFIELADNKLEDNYAERCGFDHDYEFEKCKDNEYLRELKTTETAEQKKKNTKALKEGRKLEEKEWNEMFELLKDMRGWWD